MSSKCKKKKDVKIEKVIDFGKQLFATVLRSRKGALTELSRLLRFQSGTKGFHRQYEQLLPLITELKEAYQQCVLEMLPAKGLRLGIIDDTTIKKTGKYFPYEKIQYDHTSNSFYPGMKVVSSAIYQYGKIATISSRIVKEKENKLLLAKDDADILIDNYSVDMFLFDSWYCKSPLLEKINERENIYLSHTNG